MGKTIVCWSPVHGQGANTSNTVALAAVASLETPYKSLLTHTQLSYSTMEGMFSKKKTQGYDDGGIVALKRLVKSKLLKPDDVPDYTDTIYKSRLDFLPGGSLNTGDNEAEQMLYTILRAAQKKYDLLWIDAHSGDANSTISTLLSQADLILVNLPQNKYIVEKFFTSSMYLEVLMDKPYLIVLGQYDNKANYSLRNMRRQYKVKAPMFAIPYETSFRDAVNQETVTEFFYRSIKTKKGDSLYPFMNAIREINEAVMKKLDVSPPEDEWL